MGVSNNAMPRATFDILDAAIPDEYSEWLGRSDELRFMPYRRTFLTDPVYWTRHRPDDWVFQLQWREFRYQEASSPQYLDQLIQSDDPGIYIFYVRPDVFLYHFPRFAFYIGISNEHGSNRPLRERLKDYLPSRVKSKKKRDNIDQMLQMYYGVLWIAYALASHPSTELMEMESKLHGFIFPCYARRDYPSDIKTQQKRFGVT